MPNWITNRFQSVGNQEKFNELVFNEEGQVDFNILIPMPKELNITSGSNSYVNIPPVSNYPEGSLGDNNYNIIKNMQPTLEKFYNEEISQEEFANKVVEETLDNPDFVWYGVDEEYENKDVKLKAQGYWNLQRYGKVDWYEWCRNNWGAKCNAWNCYGDEFETAWCTPYRWLEELGKHVDFIMYYADEDLGSNFGIVVAKNGKVVIYDYEKNNDDDYKNIIIAMWLKGYYGYLDDLRTLLVENYKLDEDDAETYSSNAEQYVDEFENFAKELYNNLESVVRNYDYI